MPQEAAKFVVSQACRRWGRRCWTPAAPSSRRGRCRSCCGGNGVRVGTRHELKVPKTCATWPDAPLTAGCSSPRRLAARAWDDLRLVGLKHPPDPGLGREYEDFYNTHRRHRTLNQAAPLRPLPDGVTDLDHFRAGGVIHEYRLVA